MSLDLKPRGYWEDKVIDGLHFISEMKILYFILGAIIPLPIFLNLLTGEILILKTSLDNYLFSFGAPVPLGMFAIVLLGMLSVVVKRNSLREKGSKKGLIISIVLGGMFLIHALLSLDFLRVVSLILPFGAVIFVLFFYRINTLFTYSMKGYFFAMSLFVVAHALSITIYEVSEIMENKMLLFTSFFGYAIYQALVSYSAVLSFFGCSLVILTSMPGSPMRRIGSLVLLMMIFYILGYGARKAVLLDVFMLCISFMLVGVGGVLIRLRLQKAMLNAYVLLGVTVLYLLFFSGLAERDLSYSVAVSQRGGAYEEFWKSMLNSSVVDFVFGHGGGWGGYSNIFVELIYRLGLFGVLCYLLSLVLLLKRVGAKLLRHFVTGGYFNRIDYHFKVWFTFLVLSLLAANSVNMSLQLPYYVINIAFISLFFLQRTKEFMLVRNSRSLKGDSSSSHTIKTVGS
jgi:hypothetical protein